MCIYIFIYVYIYIYLLFVSVYAYADLQGLYTCGHIHALAMECSRFIHDFPGNQEDGKETFEALFN